MSAILEIPEVRQRVSRLSVEEYHRLDEFNAQARRTELIRGIVIEKMSKSPLHCSIAKRLYDTIARILPKGFVVRREDPITLADSEPEPDIAVVRGAEADFYQAHPTTAELVIEVAVASPTLDRENASLYAEGGVRSTGLCSALSAGSRCMGGLRMAVTRKCDRSASATPCNAPACRRCKSLSAICSRKRRSLVSRRMVNV